MSKKKEAFPPAAKPAAPAAPAPAAKAAPAAPAPHAAPAPAAPAPAAAAPAAHADAQQDIALFQKLLQQHLGDAHANNPEALQMAQSIHGKAMASGMDANEAMNCAGYGVKAAALMGEGEEQPPQAPVAQKQSEKKESEESEESEEKKESEESEESEEKKESEENEESEEKKESEESEESESEESEENEESEEKKEATSPADVDGGKAGSNISKMEAKIIKLTAELTALKETNKKGEIANHLDKVLKESGLSMAATKAFRSLVDGKKSVKEIDDMFKTYREAFKGSVGRTNTIESFAFATEKVIVKGDGKKATTFGDCIK